MERGTIGGFLLGISLGGLFDGILLHQVLQWHHLLSLVESQPVQDLRTQILADGLFHLLMYVIACVGLWLLWSGRSADASAPPLRLIAITVLGFGIWQFLDVVVFHWIARIHRIRLDVDNPLAWDIGWLIVFGLPAVIAGCWLLARARKEPPSGRNSIRRTSATLTTLIVAAGLTALLPPRGPVTTIAVFGAEITPTEAFAAVAASRARVIWAHSSGTIVAVQLDDDASRMPLYRAGAIVVTGAYAPCVTWSKA